MGIGKVSVEAGAVSGRRARRGSRPPGERRAVSKPALTWLGGQVLCYQLGRRSRLRPPSFSSMGSRAFHRCAYITECRCLCRASHGDSRWKDRSSGHIHPEAADAQQGRYHKLGVCRMTPDIIVSLRFLSPREGGRASLPRSGELACIFEAEGRSFDCRIMLGEAEETSASMSFRASVTFLFPEGALESIHEGSPFRLRDYRVIAEGVVESIPGPALTAVLPPSAESRQ